MLTGPLGAVLTTMTAGAAARPHEASIARYQSHLERAPHNETLLVSLGDLHHESGVFEEALEFYRRCLARNPSHLGAAALKRPIGSGGRSLLDHLQAYVRAQAARADANASLPPGRKP